MDVDKEVIFIELVNYFLEEVKALNCAKIDREEGKNPIVNVYSDKIHVTIVER